MDPTLGRPERNAPTQTVVERYIQLRGCQYVDEIVPTLSSRSWSTIRSRAACVRPSRPPLPGRLDG